MLISQFYTDVLWKALEFSQAHGEIVKTYLGFNEPSLLITNDKLIEAVLGSSKLIEKSPEYRYFFRWLGTGLLTSGSNYKFQNTINGQF